VARSPSKRIRLKKKVLSVCKRQGKTKSKEGLKSTMVGFGDAEFDATEMVGWRIRDCQFVTSVKGM